MTFKKKKEQNCRDIHEIKTTGFVNAIFEELIIEQWDAKNVIDRN